MRIVRLTGGFYGPKKPDPLYKRAWHSPECHDFILFFGGAAFALLTLTTILLVVRWLG